MIALHICDSPPDVLRRPSSACSGHMPHFGGGPFLPLECLLRQGGVLMYTAPLPLSRPRIGPKQLFEIVLHRITFPTSVVKRE